MERWKALTLTPGMVLGLFFLQRYRFLTIAQVARAAGLSFDHTAELLRGLEVRGIVGHFGHVRIPGHGKTPKAYYRGSYPTQTVRRRKCLKEKQETEFSPVCSAKGRFPLFNRR